MTRFSTSFLLGQPLDAVDLMVKEHWPTLGVKTIPLISKTFSEHFDNEHICLGIPLINPYSSDAINNLGGKLVRFHSVVRNNALETEYVLSVDQVGNNQNLWKTIANENFTFDTNRLISRTILVVECAAKFLNLSKGHEDFLIEYAFIYNGRGDEFLINGLYEFYGTIEENTIHVLFFRPIDFLTKQVNYIEAKEVLLKYLESFGLDPKVFSLVLCSRVAQRVEGLLDTAALGNISLCISKCDQAKADFLFEKVLSPIIPSFRIQINKDNLENSILYPELNLETGEIPKTPLQQLVRSSFLLLDECSLEATILNDCGTKNIRALIELIKDQTIPYDFGYSEGHIPTDVAVIVTSKTAKSLLRCTLCYDATNLSESIQEFDTALIFDYIQKVRRLDVTIDSELNGIIETDFIEARKEDPKFYTDDNLHLAISAARTFAAMEGREAVSEEDWRNGLSISKKGRQ